jgi:hypothetical protein
MGLRIAALALVGASIGAPMACAAEPAVPATLWLCRNSGHQSLACAVQRATAAPQLPLASPATDRPDLSGLPPIVREIRQRPASWRARTLFIPLYTEPYGTDHLQLLAQAVLCGAEPACSARLGDAGPPTPDAWPDFVDDNDPLLAQND